MNARTLDLTPFHRATIGFDKIFDLMDRQFANSANTGGYPPYNIVMEDDNHYHIELAVAGFRMEDLAITLDRNELTIEGSPAEAETTGFLHKGIANRTFKRLFTLADHMEVKAATLELGILKIVLERYVPEELMPKKIDIKVNS